MDERIAKVKGMLEEYADCRQELDPAKVASEIDALYRPVEMYEQEGDHIIAENMRSYWANLNAGSAR